MAETIPDADTLTTRALLGEVIVRTNLEHDSQVAFLCESSTGDAVVQRLRMEISRARKRLMKQGIAALVPQAMQDEGEIFRRQLASPTAKEAFSAFLEKRKPDFSKFE